MPGLYTNTGICEGSLWPNICIQTPYNMVSGQQQSRKLISFSLIQVNTALSLPNTFFSELAA